MTSLPCTFTLIDPDTNKARWYYIDTATDLFGETVLIKRWGRIGRTGQEKLEWFDDLNLLENEVKSIMQRRKRHGYQNH